MSSVSPVYTLSNPVSSYTGATLGPLQCMYSVHCQCTSSVYTIYTGIWSGWVVLVAFFWHDLARSVAKDILVKSVSFNTTCDTYLHYKMSFPTGRTTLWVCLFCASPCDKSTIDRQCHATERPCWAVSQTKLVFSTTTSKMQASDLFLHYEH